MTNRTARSGEAAETARMALRELLNRVPSDGRRELIRQIGTLMEEHALREREWCVESCRRRAELWRTTSAARSSVAMAREEARARANEALYLADLLASGGDTSEQPEPEDESN